MAESLAISNYFAAHGNANFATEPERLEDWLAAWRTNNERYPWLVAREAGRVIGFAKSAPYKTRGAYAWTAELSVYVRHGAHRKGLGRALYDRLIPLLKECGIVTLIAGITLPNPGSERLHAAVGFSHCGTFKRVGYKNGRFHDVGWYTLDLEPGVEHPIKKL